MTKLWGMKTGRVIANVFCDGCTELMFSGFPRMSSSIYDSYGTKSGSFLWQAKNLSFSAKGFNSTNLKRSWKQDLQFYLHACVKWLNYLVWFNKFLNSFHDVPIFSTIKLRIINPVTGSCFLFLNELLVDSSRKLWFFEVIRRIPPVGVFYFNWRR